MQCQPSCTTHLGTKEQENNCHANHRAFFFSTGCFEIVRQCLERMASEVVLGVDSEAHVVFM